jgi:hypothetical protein
LMWMGTVIPWARRWESTSRETVTHKSAFRSSRIPYFLETVVIDEIAIIRVELLEGDIT